MRSQPFVVVVDIVNIVVVVLIFVAVHIGFSSVSLHNTNIIEFGTVTET